MSEITKEKDGNHIATVDATTKKAKIPAFRDIFKKKVPPLSKDAIDAMEIHEDDLPLALKGQLVDE